MNGDGAKKSSNSHNNGHSNSHNNGHNNGHNTNMNLMYQSHPAFGGQNANYNWQGVMDFIKEEVKTNANDWSAEKQVLMVSVMIMI